MIVYDNVCCLSFNGRIYNGYVWHVDMYFEMFVCVFVSFSNDHSQQVFCDDQNLMCDMCVFAIFYVW